MEDNFSRNGGRNGRRIYRKVCHDVVGVPLIKNRFEALTEDDDIRVSPVEAKKLTRLSEVLYNVADVQRPLASAVLVAKAGNTIVLHAEGGYIENAETKDKMEVRVEKNTYVFDIQLEDGSQQTVTLDSGAGCNVWPVHIRPAGVVLDRSCQEVKMSAANGSPIRHYGQASIRFRGNEATGFTRQKK